MNSKRARLGFLGLLAAYLLAYGFAVSRRQPAGNMAYWIYSESEGTDRFCYEIFLPAYRAQKTAWRLLHRPFGPHNNDRPVIDNSAVGL